MSFSDNEVLRAFEGSQFEEAKSVDSDELFKKLKRILEDSLLPKAHTIPEKLKIEAHANRVSFACPYCGDSAKDVHAKRGNLYIESTFYKCYNCEEKKPFLNVLEDFGLADSLTIIEKHNLRNIKLNPAKSNFRKNIVHHALNEGKLKGFLFDRKEVKDAFGFLNATSEKKIINILEYRKVRRDLWSRFLYDPVNNHLICLNSDESGEKIISFQRRKLGAFKKNKYLTENYSAIRAHIFDVLGKDPFPDLSEDAVMFYDTLSYYL